jgi:hypothetical protein
MMVVGKPLPTTTPPMVAATPYRNARRLTLSTGDLLVLALPVTPDACASPWNSFGDVGVEHW